MQGVSETLVSQSNCNWYKMLNQTEQEHKIFVQSENHVRSSGSVLELGWRVPQDAVNYKYMRVYDNIVHKGYRCTNKVVWYHWVVLICVSVRLKFPLT
jgi:hypothetical protein